MVGFIVAVLVLSCLVMVHEVGHFLVARRAGVGVETFSFGFGRRLWGVKRGDTDYRISAIPLGGYVKMVGEQGEIEGGAEAAAPAGPPPDPARSFEHKPVGVRMLVIVAGPLFNFLFAIAVFWAVFLVGVPIKLPVVGTVVANSPAADAGLRAGDTMTAVDGKRIETFEDLQDIVTVSAGRQLLFSVQRGGESLTLSVTPRASDSKTIFGEATRVGLIGVTFGERYGTKRFGPGEAAAMAVRRTGEVVLLTFQMIVKMFQRVVPANTIGGPIMIVQMVGQQTKIGVLNLVFTAAFLSVQLGLFNLFPIPVLDGGHLWFLAIEALRGRPVSRRAREITQQVGLVLLALLMVFAFYNDIGRLITGKGP
jgi:regulator of sigma E protease